jgi:tetratricopeptide (TPR) repeat protein
MKKKQYVTIGLCSTLLIVVYLFANTKKPSKDLSKEPSKAIATEGSFHFEAYLVEVNKGLNADTLQMINNLLPNIANKKVSDTVGMLYNLCNHPEVTAYYQSLLATTMNDDTTWSMAGERNYLAGVLSGKNEELRAYLFERAIEAFKKASAMKPNNDTYKVKLATCYMDGTPDVMSGVSILREIVARDSNNVDAQFTLGRYGIVSGQFDKSIVRLEKVISLQPSNADAYLLIAEAYEKIGDIEKAIKALEKGKSLVEDPSFKQEIADYIAELKKKI